jgi:FkbM family methyltransferase
MTIPTIMSLRGHHFYTGILDTNSTVVDLGAHRGEFSTLVSEQFGCKCYAVEASPDLCSLILENRLLKPYNYVINDSNQPVKFHLAHNPECNTIYNLPTQTTDKVVQVEGITLDKFLEINQINQIDLLKVDIEGAEIELFNSLSDATIAKIKQISVEFHDFLPYIDDMREKIKAIKARLKKLGFACIIYTITCHEDVLFLNRDYCQISNIDMFYFGFIDKYKQAFQRKFLQSKKIA